MSSPTAESAGRLHNTPHPGLTARDQRRQRTLAQWRRHSALIHVLRRVLPLLCAAMLLALGGWALLNTLFWRLGAAQQSGALVIRMLKPNFQGRDEKGQPYLLSAASALRDDKDSALITMEWPVFTLGSGLANETRVRAKHGVYREDTRILDLTGDVHLDDAEGYHFVSEHAIVDTNKNNVDGEQHIDGFGPLGRIAASSYAVRNGGAYIYFTGHVKARIQGRAPAASSSTQH